MMKHYDIIIVGGGLAGLTAALHLAKDKHRVLVLEKNEYPHHKVCGEYVSNEIIPYMKSLGVSLSDIKAVAIDTFQLSTHSGRSMTTTLPLGGLGISRYAFDHYLFEKAKTKGVHFSFRTVTSISFKNNTFEVLTDDNDSYTAAIVIGAYGKRSAIDKQLKRDFIQQKSAWLAVKAHYDYPEFPENKVALHNFTGGYGGLSKTETGAVNFCYLTTYDSFQSKKNVTDFNATVVAENPYLESFLNKAKPIFEVPLTIAQISFEPKTAVENHILMCGDTAGLIHPLCGNGMAMAIHSAKIAASLINRYLKQESFSRNELESTYSKQWQANFGKRLWMGRRLQSLLLHKKYANFAIGTAIKSPALLQKLIKTTHGKPILCE